MGTLFRGALGGEQNRPVAVIMAGGSGTRFWPLSREGKPKQFLSLTPVGRTLIQETASRLEPLVGSGRTLVVSGRRVEELLCEQLPSAALLLEPLARNTAPCVGFAAIKVLATLGDVPMICLPADHLIDDAEALRSLFNEASELARTEDVLITIGIQPDFPETGYGYIERGAARNKSSKTGNCFAVERFVEKPDLATAKEYMESGNYFWNSGMFVWRPSVVLQSFKEHLPELYRQLLDIQKAFGSANELEQCEAIFQKITPISVDYGIMERAKNAVMFSGKGLGWSDVGSWSAWMDCLKSNADSEGNVARADSVFINSNRCATIGGKRLIACVGVDDLIVVDTDDAILICNRESAQEVKQVVELLKKQGRKELL